MRREAMVVSRVALVRCVCRRAQRGAIKRFSYFQCAYRKARSAATCAPPRADEGKHDAGKKQYRREMTSMDALTERELAIPSAKAKGVIPEALTLRVASVALLLVVWQFLSLMLSANSNMLSS